MMKFKHKHIIIFIVLFLSYGICYLTYFPGVGMNDGLNILFFGMRESRQHPVLYVGSIMAAKRVGYLFSSSMEAGIAIHVLLQMIIVCILTTLIILWLFSKNFPLWIKILLFSFYVFHPLVVMYAVSMLKDTLFSLVLTIYAICCYEIGNRMTGVSPLQTRVFRIMFIMCGAFLILWRNNGRYIVFPLVLLMFTFIKNSRKWLAAAFAAALAAVVINDGFTGLLGEKAMFQEAAGIPLQQVCRVVVEDGIMTDEQKDLIDHLMPLDEIKQHYNPRSIDPIKWNEHFDSEYLEKHKGEFLKTWYQMLGTNLAIYCKAYLDATYYFWRPVTGRKAQCFFTIMTTADNYWLPELMEKNGIRDLPIIRGEAGEKLREYYQRAVNTPSEACLFWTLAALTAFACFCKKTMAPAWGFWPLLLLWGTIMISAPVAGSMRYVLAFVYSLPVFAGIVLDHGNAE